MNRALRNFTFLRYGSFIVIVIIIGSLGWWYFFLRTKGDALEAGDLGRGAGVGTPSFQNIVGSTYGNIISNLSSLAGGGASTEEGREITLSRLARITTTPVAGTAFMTRGASSTLRFVERGTGYVLEADPRTGELVRFTNTLVPQIFEAHIGSNGVLILRSIDDSGAVITNAAQSTTTSPTEEPLALSLISLPQRIRSIALSASGEEVLYLTENTSGGASVTQADWDGGGSQEIAELGISGWSVLWPDGHRLLVQHAAPNVTSYAYELGSGGTLSSVLPGAQGLTIAPKTSAATSLEDSPLLYSTLAGGLSLRARTDAEANAQILPVRTFADKCVWAPGSTLVVYCAVPQVLPSSAALARRARGGLHTADAWWRVDVRAGTAGPIYTPEETLRLDVESPKIDPTGAYIAFMNAADKSLWLLRIAE